MSRTRTASSRSPVWSAVGRFVAVAAVIGAGVAGWFGFERFVLMAETERDEIWADLPFADTTWDSFIFRSAAAGGVVDRVSHDATTGATRIETLAAGGLAVTTEALGTEAWQRERDGAWISSAETSSSAFIETIFLATPVRITDVIPAAADRFVTVVDRTAVGDAYLYELTIDTDAFGREAPIASHDWVERLGDVDLDDPSWRLRIRNDGYIMRWSGLADSVELSWRDLQDPLLLESPIAAHVAQPPIDG